jgi:hypothetical protein
MLSLDARPTPISLRCTGPSVADGHRFGVAKVALAPGRGLQPAHKTDNCPWAGPNQTESCLAVGLFENRMNIEHDSERISLHDFNELEGNSLRGFLNIQRKGIISQNPLL